MVELRKRLDFGCSSKVSIYTRGKYGQRKIDGETEVVRRNDSSKLYDVKKQVVSHKVMRASVVSYTLAYYI